MDILDQGHWAELVETYATDLAVSVVNMDRFKGALGFETVERLEELQRVAEALIDDPACAWVFSAQARGELYRESETLVNLLISGWA